MSTHYPSRPNPSTPTSIDREISRLEDEAAEFRAWMDRNPHQYDNPHWAAQAYCQAVRAEVYRSLKRSKLTVRGLTRALGEPKPYRRSAWLNDTLRPLHLDHLYWCREIADPEAKGPGYTRFARLYPQPWKRQVTLDSDRQGEECRVYSMEAISTAQVLAWLEQGVRP